MTKLTLLTIGSFILVAATASSQEVAPSQIAGTSTPILDEFGEVLLGTPPSAHLSGTTPVTGDLVEFYLATDNTIYPPDVLGEPDPRNQLVGTSRIGLGIARKYGQSGRFSTALSPRPGGNARIFARVYNAATKEEASFYGDSQLFRVLSWKNDAFFVEIEATDQPLDPNDDDGDGLNNSWERSYGTDAQAADTDGDGLTDGEEILAQNDALDASSFLQVTELAPAGGDDLYVRWEANEGVHYRVEASSGPLQSPTPFAEIGQITAESDVGELLVPGGLTNLYATYRVCVVEQEE